MDGSLVLAANLLAHATYSEQDIIIEKSITTLRFMRDAVSICERERALKITGYVLSPYRALFSNFVPVARQK